MNLPGAPQGYITLPKLREKLSEVIASVAGHKVSELKKILNPDEVEKAPPSALSKASFRALFVPVGQGKLDVFTTDPVNGLIVRVPTNVFTNSATPEHLFGSPSPHFDPGLPPGFEEFRGRTLFVANDSVTKSILEQAARSILDGRKWPEKEASGHDYSKGQIWALEANTIMFWPVEFCLLLLGHAAEIDKALEEYAAWIDYDDDAYPSEMAFCKYGASGSTIERWARSGELEIHGVRVLRNGIRERPSMITPLDWTELQIRHDIYSGRGLYASVPRPVPFAEWWEKLHVSRTQFSILLETEVGVARPKALKRRGRKPGSPYKEADEALFPDIKKLIELGQATSPHAAANELHRKGVKIPGKGTPENRIRRLASAYIKHQQK